MDSRPSNNFEDSLTPLKIFPIAHAVRSSKKSIHVNNKSKIIQPDILYPARNIGTTVTSHEASQIKDIFEMSYEEKKKYPSLQGLPTNAVVSKIVTRNQGLKSDKENEDPLKNFDISLCRKFKLTPPSWRNKFNQKKKIPGFKKIVNSMKERCSQFNENIHTDSKIFSQDRRQPKSLNNLLNSIVGTDYNGMIAQNEYNTSNGEQQEQQRIVKCQDEDPLPNTENSEVEVVDTQDHPTLSENLHRPWISPKVQESREFVWNPVLIPLQSRKLFSLLEDNTSDYRDLDLENMSESRWQSQIPVDSHVSTDMNSLYSPDNCETSSTSSGQTVAEERLQYIYYTERRRASHFDGNLDHETCAKTTHPISSVCGQMKSYPFLSSLTNNHLDCSDIRCCFCFCHQVTDLN